MCVKKYCDFNDWIERYNKMYGNEEEKVFIGDALLFDRYTSNKGAFNIAIVCIWCGMICVVYVLWIWYYQKEGIEWNRDNFE